MVPDLLYVPRIGIDGVELNLSQLFHRMASDSAHFLINASCFTLLFVMHFFLDLLVDLYGLVTFVLSLSETQILFTESEHKTLRTGNIEYHITESYFP